MVDLIKAVFHWYTATYNVVLKTCSSGICFQIGSQLDLTIESVYILLDFGHTCVIGDLNPAEQEAACFTARCEAALQAGAPELLTSAAVDGVESECGSDLPDVGERNACELTTPAASKPAPTQHWNTKCSSSSKRYDRTCSWYEEEDVPHDYPCS
jgi:hypothetical protein